MFVSDFTTILFIPFSTVVNSVTFHQLDQFLTLSIIKINICVSACSDEQLLYSTRPITFMLTCRPKLSSLLLWFTQTYTFKSVCQNFHSNNQSQSANVVSTVPVEVQYNLFVPGVYMHTLITLWLFFSFTVHLTPGIINCAIYSSLYD